MIEKVHEFVISRDFANSVRSGFEREKEKFLPLELFRRHPRVQQIGEICVEPI